MGPLSGIRIIEIAGIGPGPFCGMMLADHGAEVIRVDRTPAGPALFGSSVKDVLNRSRKGISVNLKSPEGTELVRRLCRSADGLIEGFRPGVMERLGLGPDVLLQDNPKLVYGRMTGWGQDGPYAHTAGHDINYIALSGALHAIGRAGEKPLPPINLVGDFGGGGMMLAFGMVAALLKARETGAGQVVDCAMTEGSAVLMSMMYSIRSSGHWTDKRGSNIIDSGAHFYDTYETSDGRFISLGAVEPQFYRQLLELLGLSHDEEFQVQMDARRWPRLKDRLTELFKTRTRDEWCRVFEGTDVCFAPVMSMAEAPAHAHNAARRAFVEIDGVVQPAPAPRYSATPTHAPTAMTSSEAVTAELLSDIGYSTTEIDRIRSMGVVV